MDGMETESNGGRPNVFSSTGSAKNIYAPTATAKTQRMARSIRLNDNISQQGGTNDKFFQKLNTTSSMIAKTVRCPQGSDPNLFNSDMINSFYLTNLIKSKARGEAPTHDHHCASHMDPLGKNTYFEGFLDNSIKEFNDQNKWGEYMNSFNLDLKNFLTFEAMLVGTSTKSVKSYLYSLTQVNEKIRTYRSELGIIVDKIFYGLNESLETMLNNVMFECRKVVKDQKDLLDNYMNQITKLDNDKKQLNTQMRLQGELTSRTEAMLKVNENEIFELREYGEKLEINFEEFQRIVAKDTEIKDQQARYQLN
jgi:hypothetical protein